MAGESAQVLLSYMADFEDKWSVLRTNSIEFNHHFDRKTDPDRRIMAIVARMVEDIDHEAALSL